MSVGNLVEAKLRLIRGRYGLGPFVLFCSPRHFERLDPQAIPLTPRGAYLDSKTLWFWGLRLRPIEAKQRLLQPWAFSKSCRSRHSKRLDPLIDPLTPRAANLDPDPEWVLGIWLRPNWGRFFRTSLVLVRSRSSFSSSLSASTDSLVSTYNNIKTLKIDIEALKQSNETTLAKASEYQRQLDDGRTNPLN